MSEKTNTTTTTILTAAIMMSMFVLVPISAHAQYMGNVGAEGETGAFTLEEMLKIQAQRVAVAQDNPGAGSGTPYLDATGIVGASIISGAVFGGIAGAFFLKGRSGRYAAMGRG